MKKSSKIILIVILIVVIAALGVGGYFLLNPKQENKSQESSNVASNNNASSSVSTADNQSTAQNNINTTTSSTENEKVLYTYASGDNAAAHGNGELLYVYEMNDNVIRFKYRAPWNEEDISGTATKSSQDLYVYEKGTYKIELLLNSMGNNSIKVSEYTNGNIQSWKNLWKDGPNTSTSQTATNNVTNVSDINGKYQDNVETKSYVHHANIELKNATEEKIDFAITAAHGNDVDHVSTGEVSGTAKKTSVPDSVVVPNSVQFAYEFSEEIEGKTNKITIVYTRFKQFQYVEITEDYPDGRNPYAGNRVFFQGEYEKVY